MSEIVTPQCEQSFMISHSETNNDEGKPLIHGMLALKLNVPRNQPDEPSDRTVQSSGWSWEVNPDDEPGLPLDSSRPESLVG